MTSAKAAFTQPGDCLLAEPCTLASEDDEARNGGGSNDGGDAAKKHFSETHDDQENSLASLRFLLPSSNHFAQKGMNSGRRRRI